MTARTTLPLLTLFSLGLTATAFAAAPEEPQASDRAVKVTIGGGYLHQFDTDFDDEGSLSVDRGYGAVGSSFELSPALSLGLRVAWEGAWYRFEPEAGGAMPLSLGSGASPWHSVQGVQLGGRLGWSIDDHWQLSAGVFGSAAGEPDADAGDSLSFGGTLAAAYRASDRLTIGGGVLIASQIEDDALVIPLFVLDWRITDSLRLSNVAGPEAYPTGAGLELLCQAWEGWEFGIGGRWESRRFRLDDTGPAPNGVGEDSGLGLWLRAGVRPIDALRIDLLVGMMVSEELELSDRNGNELATSDLDPSPFLACFVSYRF
ncbi:MAG: hypothetical protein JNL80_12275 [Phycisphaerae bacterium]|nr:hypothetical protein [Phycisphaerae bacterium]